MASDHSGSASDRAELASEMLDGLDQGFHYSTFEYDDEGRVVAVVWNYEFEGSAPSRNDDFTDRDLSERRRELAIEHQEQYDEPGETEQAKLPMTDGGEPQETGIEQYLQQVADHLRPFKAWEKVGDGIYLLRADEEVTVGKKMARQLLSRGYVVESCHGGSLRVREVDLSGGELVFRREQPAEDDAPEIVTDGGVDQPANDQYECPSKDCDYAGPAGTRDYYGTVIYVCRRCGHEIPAAEPEMIGMTDDGLVMPDHLVGFVGNLVVEWPNENLQKQIITFVEPGVSEVCEGICRGVMPSETDANGVPGGCLRINGDLYRIDDGLRADGSGGTKWGDMIEGHEWDSPEDEGTGWRERTTGVADLEVTLHNEGYQTDRRWTVHVRRGHRDHPVAVYSAEHQNKGNFWREPELWRDAVDFVELPLAVRKRVASMLNRPVEEITPEVRMAHREDGAGVGDRAGGSSGTCEVCGGTLHDDSDTHGACEAGDRDV